MLKISDNTPYVCSFYILYSYHKSILRTLLFTPDFCY